MVSDWNATEFFRNLLNNNKLAQSLGFSFTRVSGLEGFEQAMHKLTSAKALLCVSDEADGYMDLNNTPRSRRIKTVFMAMRHQLDNMPARAECFENMNEIFRQFMSVLTRERVKLEQNSIFIDPRVSFNQIDRYFFAGGACAYFQVVIDLFTDLRFNEDEWADDYVPETEIQYINHSGDIWLTDYDTDKKLEVIKLVRSVKGYNLKEAKELVEASPTILLANTDMARYKELKPQFDELNAVIQFRY
jgi:hypothetical protein